MEFLRSSSHCLRSLLAVYVAVFVLGNCAVADETGTDNEGLKRLQVVLDLIRTEYVSEIGMGKILEYAVHGMLSSLDPHSAYLDQKEYRDVKNANKGEFEGLGMELTIENGVVKVIAPYEDAPAFKAGIKPGDYITVVNGQLLKGMNLLEVAEKLRGAPGTKVALKIYRESVGIVDLEVVRDVVKIVPVKSRVMRGGAIGYVKISMFNDKVAAYVRKEWAEMIKNHPNVLGLVIDLRGNPGGLLDQAYMVADLFITSGDIVTIKARNPQYNQIFKADAEDITNGLPIVILINGGTASAAEIVAGAVQDNKRGLIVGVKSFGKGSVQKIIPLADGAAVKMTTALYYTPAGTSIQAYGIVPDIVVHEAVVKSLHKTGALVSESSLSGFIESKEGASKREVGLNIGDTNEHIISGEELKDFQLLRAADVVQAMALLSTKNK